MTLRLKQISGEGLSNLLHQLVSKAQVVLKSSGVFLFIMMSLLASAQQKDSTVRHPDLKPAFDIDQRFSFISKQVVNIWGLRGGVYVNNKFKLGLGGYFLTQKVKNIKIRQANTTDYMKRSLYFGTVYYEPFLIRRNLWELSLPFEAGYGKAYSTIYNEAGIQVRHTRNFDFLPLGAGVSFSLKPPPHLKFKPLRWVGYNFLAGYRFCPFTNDFRTDYNGFFYSIGLALLTDRISEDVRYWKGKKKSSKH